MNVTRPAPLNPCPDCGGEAEREMVSLVYGHEVWCIRCPRCGLVSPRNPLKHVATRSWNLGKFDRREKEVHVHTTETYDCLVSLDTLIDALNESDYRILHTTELLMIDTDMFRLGFRLFVHDDSGEYEIKLGKNERTAREIKMEHNLLKLWRGGEFR